MPPVAGVLPTNTLFNTGILSGLGASWRDSLYTGALLAQIGEYNPGLCLSNDDCRYRNQFIIEPKLDFSYETSIEVAITAGLEVKVEIIDLQS